MKNEILDLVFSFRSGGIGRNSVAAAVLIFGGLFAGCAPIPRVVSPPLPPLVSKPAAVFSPAVTVPAVPRTLKFTWTPPKGCSSIVLSSADLKLWRIEPMAGRELNVTNQAEFPMTNRQRFYRVVNLQTP